MNATVPSGLEQSCHVGHMHCCAANYAYHLPTQASIAGMTRSPSALIDGTRAMQMRVASCCTWAQASDRNLSCEVGVAVISLISSSLFSIIVFMASSADSLARSFSAHLQKAGQDIDVSVPGAEVTSQSSLAVTFFWPSVQQQEPSSHLHLDQ